MTLVAPFAGQYVPTGDLASGGGNTMKQARSVVIGTRLSVWLRAYWGIEGTVSYAPSRLLISNGATYPGYVLAASAKALFRLGAPQARARFHVGGGLGLVRYGGDAYLWYGSTSTGHGGSATFFSGIANVGYTFQLTRSMALRVDAEDYVFAPHFDTCSRGVSGVCYVVWPGGATTSLQHQLAWSVGVVFH
ncbi:MAG TPA: hypothetical protein VNA31_11510 [bacterium]|nr:hypothetical protein [bacterium]